MTIAEWLQQVRRLELPADASPAMRTTAAALAARSGAVTATTEAAGNGPRPAAAGVFVLRRWPAAPAGASAAVESPQVAITFGADGSGTLAASADRVLYAAVHHLLTDRLDHDIAAGGGTLTLRPAFAWNRSCYDLFLTQEGRVQRGLHPESYVRRLAESGFTHLEVNALAYPMGLETGPAGEVYPMFYTYCPALDQFVCSSLNRGLYPAYYLSANLDRLRRHAALAREYGLVPGLLCFEPRSVPEEFFARYPMLRGPRVDHPFRSFKPRYTMTLAHPLVRAHYQELVGALMAAVPDLGFLSVWSNDSGAGFEHTRSLYVGRNGGPYLIREWKTDEEIARTAGGLVVTFLRLLRDAAREVNPAFRVLTRIESFYGEHDTVWAGLGDGVDVETASLVARGWEMPYRHARYPDSSAINAGTVHQLAFDAREQTLAAELASRAGLAHFYVAVGPHQIFAPLLGVPYPRLAWRRLQLLWAGGVRAVAQVGGTCPPELVPFNVNHEILRWFQFDPGMEIDGAVASLARRWAGPDLAPALVRAWALAEEAVLAFPNVTPLYSTIGFTWYRLWVRPLVPDIEAIPRADRAYYEDFMCTTPHNPNNVDLGRDVLFTLIEPAQAARDVERMDAHVWGPLDEAIRTLEEARRRTGSALGFDHVITDQWVRLCALRCWLDTQRNVAAWVAAVHGYMGAVGDEARPRHRAAVDDLVGREIANSRRLLALLGSPVAFMAVAAHGESPLMHGDNLASLVERRIALMERHRHDEPFIDASYMERMAGQRVDGR